MSIEIKETCLCGAEFYVKDTSEYGSTAKYRYQEFLEAHEICRKIHAIGHVIENKGSKNEISSS